MGEHGASPFESGGPFDEEMLDRQAASICAVDSTLLITFVNRAWRDFSAENGGGWGEGKWTLGVSLLAAIPRNIRPFYAASFASVVTTRVPMAHSYECSSPTLLRIFRMHVFPRAPEGLLLVHSLAEERPHTREARPATDALYLDASQIVTQCSHCRRVRRVQPDGETDAAWDWVPGYVAHAPPGTVSHGLCPICFAYYAFP